MWLNYYNKNLKLYIQIIRESLLNGQAINIRCIGTSMEPTIKNGEQCTVLPLKENPEIGDIVLFFLSYDRCLMHRVIAKYNSYYITKGDNNKVEDYPSLREELLGKVYL